MHACMLAELLSGMVHYSVENLQPGDGQKKKSACSKL